jgi:hypothetical protein
VRRLLVLVLGCVVYICTACRATTESGPLPSTVAIQARALVRAAKPKKCLELYALENRFTRQEFDGLLGLCEGAKANAAEGTDGDAQQAVASEASAAVATALERLAFEASWQITLLLGALRDVLPEDPDKLLVDLATRLAKAPCADAMKALREDAKTRRAAGLVLSPLRPDTLSKACTANIDRSNKVFVVVAGHEGDQVTLAFQPPNQTWSALRLIAHVSVDGFSYWFTQVPSSSRIIVRHQDANGTVARLHDLNATTDYVTPASKDENARYCVQFEGLGTVGKVLLDGNEIPIGTRFIRDTAAGAAPEKLVAYFAARSFVRKAEHQFVILDDAGKVNAEVSVRPEELKEDGCYVRRFDMTTRTASTLLMSVEPGCGSMGIVQPRVYAFAKKYLEATLREVPGSTETVSDMEPWAAALTAIARLNVALAPMGAREDGGERGHRDTRYMLQGLAGELLRKGFNRAYVGTLSCGQGANEPSFTFVVHRLDLETAVSSKWDEATASRQNNGILTEQETVTQLNDLRDVVRAPLARLLQRPYARFKTRTGSLRVAHDPSQLIELWQPPGQQAAALLRILRSTNVSDDQTRCAEIARERRLLSPAAPPDEAWNPGQHYDVVQEDKIPLPTPQQNGHSFEERRITLGVDTAGLYVVEMRLAQGDNTWRGITRDCIRVAGDETRVRYAAQLAITPGIRATSKALRGGGTVSQVMLSLSPKAWSFGPRATWTLPLVLGYSTLARDANTPPSWNDLSEGPQFDDDGTLPLSWTRRSILLGFRSDFEYRFLCAFGDLLDNFYEPAACGEGWNRWKFFGRFSLLLDGGMISASRIHPSLRDFYDNQPTDSALLDVDVSGMVQAGFSLRLGSRMDIGAGAQAAWFGFDDALGVAPSSIRYDSLLGLGLIVEMGYHP